MTQTNHNHNATESLPIALLLSFTPPILARLDALSASTGLSPEMVLRALVLGSDAGVVRACAERVGLRCKEVGE